MPYSLRNRLLQGASEKTMGQEEKTRQEIKMMVASQHRRLGRTVDISSFLVSSMFYQMNVRVGTLAAPVLPHTPPLRTQDTIRLRTCCTFDIVADINVNRVGSPPDMTWYPGVIVVSGWHALHQRIAAHYKFVSVWVGGGL